MKTPIALALTAAVALTACHPHDHDHGEHAHEHADHGQAGHAQAATAGQDHPAGGAQHEHGGHDHDHGEHDHEHGAHVHGIGDLALIQEGAAVQISLNLDTAALWGFERAPADKTERDLVRRVLGQLSAGHRFFILSEAAHCQPTEVEILPPAGLDDPGHKGHMALEAHWRWQCDQIDSLNQVRVELFPHYPEIHRLNLQRLTEQGSGGAVLDKQNPTLSW